MKRRMDCLRAAPRASYLASGSANPTAGSARPLKSKQRQVVVWRAGARLPADARDPLGLPIEDAEPAPVRHRRHDRQQVRREAQLPVRRGRIARQQQVARPQEVVLAVAVLERPPVLRLDDRDVAVVALGEVVDVRAQLRQRAVPERVVGQADHVERHVLGGDVVVEPAAVGVVAALVEVHDEPRPRAVRVARAGGRRAQERAQRVPLRLAAVELAGRPQHAVADLVAELEHLRGRALRGERVQHVARVVVDLLGQ
jgi:hypothetical protein